MISGAARTAWLLLLSILTYLLTYLLTLPVISHLAPYFWGFSFRHSTQANPSYT